jgi:hypothetical protein
MTEGGERGFYRILCGRDKDKVYNMVWENLTLSSPTGLTVLVVKASDGKPVYRVQGEMHELEKFKNQGIEAAEYDEVRRT